MRAVDTVRVGAASLQFTRFARAEHAGARPEAKLQSGGKAEHAEQSEQRAIAELQRTDREVRAHEGAHLAAAGGIARGVSFEYVTGPDGRQYAVAGEVSLDASPVQGDPEKTIQKARQIRAAATAPAQPSGQDQQVAAQAAQMEQAARQELAERHRKEQAEALEASGAPDLGRQGRLKAYA